MKGFIFILAIVISAFAGCAVNSGGEKTAHVYKAGVVTLEPPFRQYGGLPLKLDSTLLARPDIVGVSVNLNTPEAPLLKVGDHPMSVSYHFKDGSSVFVCYDRVANETHRETCRQYFDRVDTDLQWLRLRAKRNAMTGH